MRKLALFLILPLLMLAGCAKKVTVHPGAVNNLDSYSYDVLLVEQDVINQARANFLEGKLPPTAKPFLNAAISQYNVTQAAWQAYHSGHDPANGSALQDALNALVAAVAQLQQVLGKAPVPTTPIGWLRPMEVMA